MATSAAPMRVLQLITSLHMGGAERVVQHLTRHLDRDRFQVDVCCTHARGVLGEELIAEGHEVLSLAGKSTRLMPYLTPVKLNQLIGARKYAVVHSHSTGAFLDVATVRALRRRPPIVHTFHFGNFPHVKHKRYLHALRFAAPVASKFIAVADAQRAAVIEHLRIDPGRIETVYNGVEDNPLSRDPAVRRAVREQLGVAASAVVVGCVAMMIEQKGIPFLLDAARRLADTSVDVVLVLVGGGRLLETMRQRASELGLGRAVRFLGLRADVSRLLAGFDILVSSSLWEGFAMVLLEGMAAAKPIIATDVGENRRAVVQDETGLIVPPRDAEAIAGAIARLARDPAAAAAMGSAGYRRFTQHFTVEHMVDRHAALYEALAGVSVRA